MDHKASSDRSNQEAYSQASSVRAYERFDKIFEAERKILSAIAPEITGRRLLDIGVGGGRSVNFMREISPDYVAIDYSRAMVEAVRHRFGIQTVYCCDVRDMSRFAEGSFDFAFFSFNGIDYIAHEGRLRAFAEIKRVLRPGGIFLFSSHNRMGDSARPPWRQRHFRFTRGYVKGALKAVAGLPRHWRMRHLEVRSDEYAIINDPALGYLLMTYYIDIPHQSAQLRAAGFVANQAYDLHGEPVTYDDSSPWVHYLARKPS